MEKFFLGFSIRSFPRSQNKQADILVKAVAQHDPLPPDVFFETLKQSSVNYTEEPVKFINAITSEDWRATIMAYLRGHFVPKDDKEEKRMALCARNYKIINGNLYRGGVCAPLLKCISCEEGRLLLEDIHADMCSSHIATRALVGKAFREGFYWPSAVADAHEVFQKCSNCQRHAPYSKFPPDEVQLLPPVWPLARWGIDIVGPLPTALENYKYAAVAV